MEAFYSAYKNDVILAYHWSIKIFTGLLLVFILAYHCSFVLYDVIFIGIIFLKYTWLKLYNSWKWMLSIIFHNANAQFRSAGKCHVWCHTSKSIIFMRGFLFHFYSYPSFLDVSLWRHTWHFPALPYFISYQIYFSLWFNLCAKIGAFYSA